MRFTPGCVVQLVLERWQPSRDLQHNLGVPQNLVGVEESGPEFAVKSFLCGQKSAMCHCLQCALWREGGAVRKATEATCEEHENILDLEGLAALSCSLWKWKAVRSSQGTAVGFRLVVCFRGVFKLSEKKVSLGI